MAVVLSNYCLHRIAVAVIIFLESLLFCYIPDLTSRLSKYRNEWLNEYNLNNATSGALLSLAIIHLLPEGFASWDTSLKYRNVDFRGCIVAIPILLLVTIDYLAGHHCGYQSIETINLSAGLDIHGRGSEVMDEKAAVLNMESESPESTCSDVGYIVNGMDRMPSGTFARIKRLLTSKALYLLLTFYGHSVVEGIILVSTRETVGIWSMSFGIIAHKWAECILLTSTVKRIVTSRAVLHLCCILFSLCVPFGMALGYGLHNYGGAMANTDAIFHLLAVGFFVYLSFELLTGHHEKVAANRVLLWLSYIMGAFMMGLILVGVDGLSY